MRAFAALLIAACLALAGCATTGGADADYTNYLRASQASAANADLAAQSWGTMAAACTDSRCVEHVAAVRALAEAGGGGRRNNGLAPPPAKASNAEQFARVVGALAPIAGVAANAWVSVRQSDNSVRASEQQWGAISNIVGTSVGANRDVAIAGLGTAGTLATAGPRIEVGGDYVSGTQTHAGRDMLGDGAQVGDRAGDDLASGGSRIDNRVDNSDNSDHSGGNGGTCPGAPGAPGAAGGGGGGSLGGNGGNGGNGGDCSGGGGG